MDISKDTYKDYNKLSQRDRDILTTMIIKDNLKGQDIKDKINKLLVIRGLK